MRKNLTELKLKAGSYCFSCYPMPWTEREFGIETTGNNSIDVSMELSDEEILSIVEMMFWAWDNHWFEHSISETVCSDLLKKHLPQLYDKILSVAHRLFCNKYPNSKNCQGFGTYEIFCPDEIVEHAGYTYNIPDYLEFG